MRLYKILLSASLLLIACNSQNGTGGLASNSTDTQSKITVPNAAKPHSDTLMLSEKSVIFLSPDSLAVEKMKADYADSEDFYTVADDNMYYRYLSHTYIDSIAKIDHINIVGFQLNSIKYLCFIRLDNTRKIIKTDTAAPYGVYFFDPAMPPRLIDEVDVIEEYQHYFREHSNKPAL